MKWLAGLFLMASLLTTRADDLAKAKAAFAEKDKALNTVFAALKKELRPDLFVKMQEDQRGWVDYRDYITGGPGQDGQADATPDRWTGAAELTEARIAWLKAWKKLDQRKGWAGRYSDGRGGLLEIVEKDSHVWFTLSVVRGPTSHTGEIAGQVKVNGSTGWFETKGEGEKDPTWLTFLDGLDYNGSVRVTEENSGSFHGARAYFSGNYLWLGELTAEEQKQVIEGKDGE